MIWDILSAAQSLELTLMYTNYNLGPVSQNARKLSGPEGKF